MTLKHITTLIITGFMISSIAACNTIEGIGEDLGAAGNAIDRSASENKGY